MNPIKGKVPLTLKDGREFTLVLDMEAFVEAETAYGKPMPELMAAANAGFVGASRALLYGALKACHPQITLRDASSLFLTDAEAIGPALDAAAAAAFPDRAEGGEPGNPPRPGKPSGSSGAKPASNQKRSGAKPRARSR